MVGPIKIFDGEWEEYGEYMTFFAPVHEASGGLRDCIGIFEYASDAWNAINTKATSSTHLGEPCISHVWNLRTRLAYKIPSDCSTAEDFAMYCYDPNNSSSLSDFIKP